IALLRGASTDMSGATPAIVTATVRVSLNVPVTLLCANATIRYAPGGRPATVNPKPLLANRDAPTYAPTSGRKPPIVAAPTHTGGAPDAGYAHTCTASTPLPVAAPASTAHPARPNGCRSVAFCPGVSIDMIGFDAAGAGVGAGDDPPPVIGHGAYVWLTTRPVESVRRA